MIGENLIRLADGRQVERRKSNLPVSQHGTWAFFIQAELAVFYRFTDASKTLENAPSKIKGVRVPRTAMLVRLAAK